MGRKKVAKQYTRTVGKIGTKQNHSYYVTLPIRFARSLGWHEGKKVTVKKVGGKIHITGA